MKNLEQNNAQNSSLERIKQYQKRRQDKRDINAMEATGIIGTEINVRIKK